MDPTPNERRRSCSDVPAKQITSQLAETTASPRPGSPSQNFSHKQSTSNSVDNWLRNVERNPQDPSLLPPSPRQSHISLSSGRPVDDGLVDECLSGYCSSAARRARNVKYARPDCVHMELPLHLPEWVEEAVERLFLQPTTNIFPHEERKKRYIWYKDAAQSLTIMVNLQASIMYMLGMDLTDVQPINPDTPVAASQHCHWRHQQVVYQTVQGSYCKTIAPKPDLAYGYLEFKIPGLWSTAPEATARGEFLTTDDGFCFPYFILQFGGGHRSTRINMGLNSASSALFTYNKIVQDRGFVIYATVEQYTLVNFYLMWSEPGIPGEVGISDEPAKFTSYRMALFRSLILTRPQDYEACLMLVSNIHKWGRGERYDGILEGLEKSYGPSKL
ncbi:hypothetical protein F5Y00DRAFT_249644 [Daldinia vernicosa]|uniref:uncharacterized protein n=1 Tax=Daldinia vernicosa TaxID=114800 RepID=UPI0020075A92|nr:uncharacterized protein F5Y00DRAFT_249644 [Daldinia vernicosa]KAI0844034.1 hypothetical protein F5Y00DRAFT_249644 [Daldinia vernicosa]